MSHSSYTSILTFILTVITGSKPRTQIPFMKILKHQNSSSTMHQC